MKIDLREVENDKEKRAKGGAADIYTLDDMLRDGEIMKNAFITWINRHERKRKRAKYREKTRQGETS